MQNRLKESYTNKLAACRKHSLLLGYKCVPEAAAMQHHIRTYPSEHDQCLASVKILERTAFDSRTSGKRKQNDTTQVQTHLILVQHMFSYTFRYAHNIYNIYIIMIMICITWHL
jgi:hypothetical protein